MFVGVEGEDASAAEGTDFAFVELSAECFAAVFDECDFVSVGDGLDFVHVCGVAEDFDGDDGFGFGSDGGFEFFGVHVE